LTYILKTKYVLKIFKIVFILLFFKLGLFLKVLGLRCFWCGLVKGKNA